MTIYLAGPITGLSYDEAVERRQWVADVLRRAGFTVRSPMRGEERLKGTTSIRNHGSPPPYDDAAIFARDTNDVQNSDVVLMDFTGATEKSFGSIFEFGYAWAERKYIVVVMEEGNPHEHLFVKQAASIRFENLESAVRWLTEVYAA